MIGPLPDFVDWLEFVDNRPRLIPGAPQEVKIAFEAYQKEHEEDDARQKREAKNPGPGLGNS